MARSKEATKRAKAAYTKKYREENPGKVLAYNRRTVKDRASRNEARSKVIKAKGAAAVKGKDVHHACGNPKNNSSKNLKVAKRNHSGGTKGPNKNAAKGRRKK